MLEALITTSQHTIELIQNMRDLIRTYKHRMREELPKIYRQELLNNLFNHPYTKIEFVMDELQISRITASKYLEQLVEAGFLVKEKIGRSNYYINLPLVNLLTEQH